MIYQKHFKLNQLDVMKDKFRQVEKESNRFYWGLMLAVTVFIFLTLILTFSIRDENSVLWLPSKALTSLALVGMQGCVLRMYITVQRTFLSLMKQLHYYEYKLHVVRETVTLILITTTFIFLDLANLILYSADCLNLVCKH